MRVSKKLLPSADDYVEDPVTGRRWPLVVETINGSDPVRGFWLGEPHRSAFIEWEAVADKRGVTASLKRRVRSEAAAQAALKEALQHPQPPSPRLSRTPGSEPVTPPEHGTLEWYRNELALAQERIQRLEAENNRLLDEKRESDRVLLELIDSASDNGKKAAQNKKLKAATKKNAAISRFKALIATGRLDADEAREQMISTEGYTKSTLHTYLQDELHAIGRGKRRVKQVMRKKST